MQMKKWDGKQKQVKYQLQILLSELGFFNNTKTKKTKSKPKSKKEVKQKTEQETPEFIDLHLEIINKIEDIIKKNKLQTIKKEEPIEKTTLTQIRKPGIRKPTDPLKRIKNIQNNNKKDDALFEVERNIFFNQNIQNNNLTPLSNKVTSFDEPLNNENINFIEKIEDNPNLITGLGLVDRNTSKTSPQKTMDVTITKIDLEKTKHELDIRKQQLEEAQKIVKQKEEELKKKEEEEKKLEALNKIKQKELEKEKRKKEKQRLIEQKRQEKINKIKQRALEKENKIKEKQRLLEQKKQEQINKFEEKRLQKELEIHKKLKEKEEKQEKQKLLEKLEQIKEKEDRKIKQEDKTDKPVKKIISEKTTIDLLDDEIGQALVIIDNLLEKLPEDAIYEFIHSKDFEIYERVVNKYTKK